MSEPTVDVLAVLDAHADGIEKYANTLKNPYFAKKLAEVDEGLREFRAARAAVSELIEADHALDVANDRLNKSADCSDAARLDLYEQYVAAKARRAAALVRLGGAKS